MVLADFDSSAGHSQLLIDPSTGQARPVRAGMKAYGWSPSGSSLLLFDDTGNLYVADPHGNDPVDLPGLPEGQGLSNAWWLTDTTIILEHGDPGFEIGIFDLASYSYSVMPRQSGHNRYVQGVSPTGEWWLEYDNTSGHRNRLPRRVDEAVHSGLGPCTRRAKPRQAGTPVRSHIGR